MNTQSLKQLALSDNGFLFDTTTGFTYTLNKVGTAILKKLIEGLSPREVISNLVEQFETTENIAERDVDQFINRLEELGVIKRAVLEAEEAAQ